MKEGKVIQSLVAKEEKLKREWALSMEYMRVYSLDKGKGGMLDL